MAHPASTTTRVQRLSGLGAIAFVAIAVGFAFGRILVGHGATYRMLAVGLVSGAIAWATERNGMLLATLASGCALLLALAWLVAPATTWYGVPTAETLRTLGTLATQVGAQAREYVSPAPATPALVMAGVIAIWAAVFSCAALAFRAQSPLLALVPPIALVVFADSVLDEVDHPVYGVLFLFAALAVLFADSLRRLRGWGPVWSPAGGRDRLVPVAGRNARRVGLTAVALAALAPVFVPGFGTTAVLDISRFGSDNRIRVSPLASMNAILSHANSPEDNPEVFEVSANEGSYWRMVVLDTFDGNTWEASNDEGVQLTGHSIQPAQTLGTTVTQTFTVAHDLGFGWLVGAAEPTDITIGHDVWWHPASASLQMDGWPDEGETYTVTSVRPNVDVATLRTAQAATVPTSETDVPDGIPPVVIDTAFRWTQGAETPYDKTMAIVDHLRGGDFQYTLDVSYGDSNDALAQFLHDKKGFCQQFASLTAVMLRLVGVPARVALGFTEGSPTGPGQWSVTARQYHAWVEVPFKNYGWLSFEPTPRFADPSATWQPGDETSQTCGGGPQCGTGGDKGGGTSVDDTRPRVKGGGQQQLPTNPGSDTAAGGGAIGRRPFEVLVAAAAAIAVLLAIAIPLARGVRRRRWIRAARTSRDLILAHYDVFADRALELGWPKSPGETPDEFRMRLLATDRLGEDGDPLTRLTATVVGAAYGPADPDRAAVAAVKEDTSAVLDRLRAATSWRRRLAGLYRRG